jgi:hypothetical protein
MGHVFAQGGPIPRSLEERLLLLVPHQNSLLRERGLQHGLLQLLQLLHLGRAGSAHGGRKKYNKPRTNNKNKG